MRDLLKAFGRRILHFRRLRRLSQEELADLAEMHRTYISQIEAGKRNISLKNINKLASALKISIKDLFIL